MIKFFLLLALVSAHFEILFSGTTCEGMWSKFDIPFANSNSKINIKFNNPQTPSSKIDCVIYNYLDESNILNAPRCALTSISSGAAGYCKPNTAKEITTKKFNILNEILTPNQTVEFQVDQTGWFCIEVSSPLLEDFSVSVEYINPYGRIPAQDYFKLPLYGCLSLVYLFIAIVWLFRSYRIGFNELLPIQIYLTGVIFFLMAEQAINYAYYENYNKNGSSSKVFVIIVSTFNAARNSISFYILLIVCLGYGVCRPTLGNTMKKCIILAIVHFVCGALYSAGTLLLDDKAGVLMVLIFVMPLSLSMTIFYSWTLQGLHKTMDKLKQKRQTVKLLMYQRLQMILVCSLISLIGAFTLNAININYKDSPTWKPYFWKYVWIILDGWLNGLYLIIFTSILILWRPTENNQRYGLDQLASDDFEGDEHMEAELDNLERQGHGQNISLRTGHKVREPEEHDDVEIFDVGGDMDDDDDDEVLQWAEKHVYESDADATSPAKSSSSVNKLS